MKQDNMNSFEISEEQLERTAGGHYIGPYEREEINGVLYFGCHSCGEARNMSSGEPCPVCGAK